MVGVSVKQYRKRPVVVEAVKLTTQNVIDVAAWCKAYKWWAMGLQIETLEGIMDARIGDYVIKGVEGEFYPCKPSIFEATYEAL